MTTLSSEPCTEDDLELPLPSQQPLEVDFIQQRVTEYRDVNGALPAKYDVGSQRFVERTRRVTFRTTGAGTSFDLAPDEMQDSQLALVATTESFSQAIAELQTKNKKKDEIANFSLLSECHNWDEVAKVLQRAERSYEDTDSVSGKIRKAFRRVGNHSKSIQSFVGLLPDGNYKTLCGGLTLVLTAMGRNAEVREMIAELLEDLPDFVKDCEDYAKLYPGQNMLKVRVNELYMELLGALEEVVKWYTNSAWKRLASSVLKNSTYGEAIQKRIQNIHKCRTRFHTEADKFQHYRLEAMDETEIETNITAHRIDQGVDGLQKSVNELTVEVKRRDSMVGKVVSEALNGTKDILADGLKNAKWIGRVDKLMELLEEKEKDKQEREKLEFQLKRKDSEMAKTKHLLNQLSQTPQSLTDRLSLQASVSIIEPDLALVNSDGLDSSTSFQSRSRQVTEAPEFQKWLSGSKSAVLVVEGNDEELVSVSSLSFLVALLHEKLMGQEKVLALPFFCGLLDTSVIKDDARKLSRPFILLRRILAQLLDRKQVDWEHGDRGRPCLSFVTQHTLSELEAGSFTSYLSTIVDLLSILLRMHDCIFIMIDGVDYMDQRAYNETKQLIKSLVKLVKGANAREKGEVAGSIKVLWTASTHLEYRARSGKGIVVLEMPEEVDGEDDEFDELSDDDE